MRCFSGAELEAGNETLNKVNTVVLYYLVVGSVFYHECQEADSLDLDHDEIHKRFLYKVFVVSRVEQRVNKMVYQLH